MELLVYKHIDHLKRKRLIYYHFNILKESFYFVSNINKKKHKIYIGQTNITKIP